MKVLVLAVVTAAVCGLQAAYCPAKIPLMTEWGERITPENAWREYPRPQLQRSQWTCLNGLWQYAVTSVTNAPIRPTTWDGDILVPFAIESKLSGVGRLLAPDEYLWYTRKIGGRPKPGYRTILHFDGVDFRAQVFIGHTEVTDVPHEGAQEPFAIDVTDYLSEGENELTVCVWDPTDEFIQSRGKQILEPRVCFYTRVSGIWQSVWTEEVPETHLKRLTTIPDCAASAVRFKLDVAGNVAAARVRIGIFDGTRLVVSAEARRFDRPVVVPMPEGFRWWNPEDPFLYTVKISLEETGSGSRDEVSSYFAMRSFDVRRDASGILRFHLNGKPHFILGTLDQGWWPDGLLTPPSDEAMAHDIVTLKACGFDMVRKHIKVEPLRYYHLCDKLGMLVLQDMPSSVSDMGPEYDFLEPHIVRRYGLYRTELKGVVDHLMSVPSIVMWVPYNEGWGQGGRFPTHMTLDWLKRYDPSRLVDGPSGYHDFEGGQCGVALGQKLRMTAHLPVGECEAGDVVDFHPYPNPEMPPVNDRRVSFIGEFGGLAHVVSNHVWKASDKNWGYGCAKDTETPEGLLAVYLGYVKRLADLASRGLCGCVYTQTTDVETEVNGLMTYDRKILKMPADKLKAAHEEIRRRLALSACRAR